MHTTAESIDKKGKRTSASTGSIMSKPPTRLNDVPIRALEDVEVLACGLRQNMLTMGKVGDVSTGTGCGTDFIILKWRERYAVVRGSELLKAWVKTHTPKDAKRFPKGIA